ncbi:phosphatidylinositol glycan anchor biosynthesis class U protein-like [Stegodyphus dumicola]|uniref:phosphatidylinositol glycan anchor biosynthesis class U protein-like n=1 Tax=Stegodyphus dumicola TaxID=202533 RepID=UPI0015B043C4|nr:phosphatidylinositol glycan anchor biosynthesis class U protein-like [Stegodyphus dumicola]
MSVPPPLVFLCFSLGFLIRLVFLKSAFLTNALASRVEISTPLTSWKRAVEGVSLLKHGTDPYDSDIFHESPLALIIYDYLLSYPEEWIPVIFALCDVITAVVLSFTSKIYLDESSIKEKELSSVPPSAKSLLLTPEDVKWVPFYVAFVYLLCPYSVVSCGGKSTVTFSNLILAFFILSTVAGKWLSASLLLSVLSYHSFYHISLLVPLIMYIHQKNSGKKKVLHITKLLTVVVVYFLATIILIMTSHKLIGSWHFLQSTYGCILSVPDLTPNIGLFWYFFTEMFEHFRIFFLWTFQLNVFVYTAPLAIRLRKEPIFLLFIQLIIITIFKSYPCIGDVAFYFSLLPMWSHLFHFMRQRFIVSCVLASCTLLAPTLWHLWIYSGSANANFYFAITLAFNTGQVFLLTDILSAFIKREYYLENGVKYEDGTLVLLRLQ